MRLFPLAFAFSVVLLAACGERGADPGAVTPTQGPDPAQDTATATATADSDGAAAEPCPDTAPAADGEADTETSTATVSAEDARTLRFAVRQPIDACVWLRSRDDGGRRTPAYSSYRPQVAFAAIPDEDADTPGEAAATTCSLAFETSPLEPGAGTQAALTCEDAVVVDERAGGFGIVEGGRLVGGGRVRFPQTH